MVAEPNQPAASSSNDLVAEFNAALAKAKSNALTLLCSIVAGAHTADIPSARERRLAASQVLRTPFLRVDDDGSIRDDRRRPARRATDSGSTESVLPRRQRSAFGSVDLAPTVEHVHPPDTANPCQDTNGDSVTPVALCEHPSDLQPHLAELEAQRAQIRASMSRLSPSERETIVQEAIVALRPQPRAPT